MHQPTEIIYNGTCPICAREIAAYERYATSRALPLGFTPLAAADLAQWGLSPDQAARRLHVIHKGKLIAGVDAFAILWREMPRFRWLGHLVQWPLIRPIAGLIYERVLAPLLYAMHRRRQAKQQAV